MKAYELREDRLSNYTLASYDSLLTIFPMLDSLCFPRSQTFESLDEHASRIILVRWILYVADRNFDSNFYGERDLCAWRFKARLNIPL